MAAFHETRMGRVFFEVTLPRLVEQLEPLNGNLERLDRNGANATSQSTGTQDPSTATDPLSSGNARATTSRRDP
jgi:hypothetical protein